MPLDGSLRGRPRSPRQGGEQRAPGCWRRRGRADARERSGERLWGCRDAIPRGRAGPRRWRVCGHALRRGPHGQLPRSRRSRPSRRRRRPMATSLSSTPNSPRQDKTNSPRRRWRPGVSSRSGERGALSAPYAAVPFRGLRAAKHRSPHTPRASGFPVDRPGKRGPARRCRRAGHGPIHEPDRLLRGAARGPGDAGDRQSNVHLTQPTRALGHVRGDLAGDRAVAPQRVLGDAESLVLALLA